MKQNKEITFSKNALFLSSDEFKLISSCYNKRFVQVHYNDKYLGIIDKTSESKTVHCYIYDDKEMNRVMQILNDNDIPFTVRNMTDHSQEQTYTFNL